MSHFRSVRAKATLAASAIFAVVLLAAAFALLAVLRQSMTDNLDLALELRADDIGVSLERGTPLSAIAIEDEDDALVQFLDGDLVVAASSNIEGEEALVDESVMRFETLMTPVDDEPFRVFVTETKTPDNNPVTLVVGSTMEDVDQAVEVAGQTLLLGVPALVGLVALLTWVTVGRGLRPVEAIRAEVAEIGATDLHRRVPQPGADDEVAKLAATMNDMLDRIESGSIRQQRFVSDASHELRTPIAIIRHELEVALANPRSADWPMVAEEILEEDLRMQRLVDDLLWLARHDGKSSPVDFELVDVDEVAMDQARRARAQSGDVAVTTAAIGAGQVRGNADELGRVLQNLLNNACRHAVSTVAVSVESTNDGRVVVAVDDDGPGIPTDMRAEIFERFSRSDEARSRDGGGAGLGLAIASEIVADHDATLSIENSSLGGARFVLAFRDARAS